MEEITLTPFIPTKKDYQQAYLLTYLTEWPMLLATAPMIMLMIGAAVSIRAESFLEITIYALMGTLLFYPGFIYLRVYLMSNAAAKNDEKAGETTLKLTNKELIISNSLMERKVRWEMFATHYTLKDQIFLFPNEKNQQIQFIPNRILSTPELETAFWNFLNEKNITQKTKLHQTNSRVVMLIILIDLIAITCTVSSLLRSY